MCRATALRVVATRIAGASYVWGFVKKHTVTSKGLGTWYRLRDGETRPHYWTQNVCFGFLFEFCLKYFSFSEEFQRDIIINAHTFPCKSLLLLSEFDVSWIFSTDFRKILGTSNFMKICPVGAELLHAGRRADVTKQIVTFRNFANAPKKAKTSQHGSRRSLLGTQLEAVFWPLFS
jgi:hypothetical protein